MQKATMWGVSVLLGMGCIAWAGDISVGVTIENGSILLPAEQAQVVSGQSNGQAVATTLLPLADGDGFEDFQVLAPLPPKAGVYRWTLQTAKPGRYCVTLEFNHPRNGNPFELRIGDQVLRGYAPGSGGGMSLVEIGEAELAAGPQPILLQTTNAPQDSYMTVGCLYFRPVALSNMTLPQIRAAIARHKPRKLPTELSMPRIFSDHMVLQRDRPVPVWGRAVPGDVVTVSFGGQTNSATSDATGRWKMVLEPMPASSTPRLLTVSSTRHSPLATRQFRDVLVGEVWLGSGQSNMEVSINDRAKSKPGAPVYECDEETIKFIGAGVDPLIRISSVTLGHSKEPAWVVLTRDMCRDAPATMVCSAILLRKKLDVPIGIIVRAQNSSAVGIWLSRDAVEGDVEIQRQLKEYETKECPRLTAEFPAKLKGWEVALATPEGKGRRKPAVPPPAGDTPTLGFIEGRVRQYGSAYDSQIAPVIPYALRGIVWDQGESREGIAGADMCAVLPALVRSWRVAWGREELPFFYIRKNQHPPKLPEAMNAIGHTVQIENRGLGQQTHPPDKAAYARRLVEAMEAVLYKHE